MDIVYPLIKSRKNNIELLYSLRSLKYFKHDRVFIIGHKPNWIQNVIHIPYDDNQRKGLNVIDKFNIACNDEIISDDFVWMNDDFFFLKEMINIPYYILADIDTYIKHMCDCNIAGNNYYHAMSDLKTYFPDGYNFDTHTPIVYNKKKFKNILDTYGYTRASKRSLYCNTYKAEGVYGNFPDYKTIKNDKIKDCKCYKFSEFRVEEGQEFLSIDSNMFDCKEFLYFIKNIFPKKSIYETTHSIEKKEIYKKKVFVHSKYPDMLYGKNKRFSNYETTTYTEREERDLKNTIDYQYGFITQKFIFTE